MTSKIGSRLAKNSIFNIIRALIAFPITLVILPYTLHRLGSDEFAIWALAGVISSYVQLSDFGMTESLIRFFAEYRERNDNERINQLLNTALVIYFLILAVVGSLLLSALPLIVERVLHIPQQLAPKAVSVFYIAILLFCLNLLMSSFASLINGFQRMGHTNAISLLSTIMTAVGVFYFLSHGYGLMGLVYNNAIVTLFTILANSLIAWRLFPEMRINPFRYFNREALGLIFGYSWKVQVSTVAHLLIFQIDRVLLSHFVGLEAVSIYEVANRVASQARSFVATVFTPMIPAVSALHVSTDLAKIGGLYRRAVKYMGILALSVTFLVIGLAKPFILTWVGVGYDESALTLQLLMAIYLVNLLTGPGSYIMSGLNRPEVSMRSSVMAGVINVVCCLVLVNSLGYYGIIAGIGLSLLISAGYFIGMLHKSLPMLSWKLYRQALLRPLSVAALLALLLTGAQRFVTLSGYPALIAAGIFFFCVMALSLSRGSYFDDFDRETLMMYLPFKGKRV